MHGWINQLPVATELCPWIDEEEEIKEDEVVKLKERVREWEGEREMMVAFVF